MGDVKKGGMVAREGVRGGDGVRAVLEGHVEAAEGDHLCAAGDVEVVEGGFAEGSRGGSRG